MRIINTMGRVERDVTNVGAISPLRRRDERRGWRERRRRDMERNGWNHEANHRSYQSYRHRIMTSRPTRTDHTSVRVKQWISISQNNLGKTIILWLLLDLLPLE